jgi:hypothetical protein
MNAEPPACDGVAPPADSTLIASFPPLANAGGVKEGPQESQPLRESKMPAIPRIQNRRPMLREENPFGIRVSIWAMRPGRTKIRFFESAGLN